MRLLVATGTLFVVGSAVLAGARSLFAGAMPRANATLDDSLVGDGSRVRAHFVDADDIERRIVVEARANERVGDVVAIVYDAADTSWASRRLDEVSPRVRAEHNFVTMTCVCASVLGAFGAQMPVAIWLRLRAIGRRRHFPLFLQGRPH